MSLPAWFPDGRTLDTGAGELSGLRALFDVVAPAGGRVPITLERSEGAPGEPRSWVGTATLWDSELARFGLTVGADDHPETMWVAKPVTLADHFSIGPVSTDSFWMILTALPVGAPLDFGHGGATMLPMVEHLVGVVEVAGQRQLVRLVVDDDTLDASIDFTGQLSDVERVALPADLGELAPLDFGHLAALFGNDHDPHADLEWLPEPLRQPDLLSLDGLGFSLDAQDDKVLVAVRADVGLAEHTVWQLVPGFDVLGVGHLRAFFDIAHPLDAASRQPRVMVTGDVLLGDARIEVAARWPDLAVRAQLADGEAHPIVLDDLLEPFHLPQLAGGGPKISQLALFVQPATSAQPGAEPATISLALRARDVLALPLGSSQVEIAELSVALDLGSGPDRSLATRLEGLLALGSVDVFVTAEHDHAAEGWQVRAATVEPIPLADLGNWLVERFGDQPVPTGMLGPAPEITSLSIALDTAARDLTVQLVTAFHLDAHLQGELALDLQLAHHGGDHYEPRLGGRFTIGGEHHFDLLVARDAPVPPTPPTGAAPRAELLVGAYQHVGRTTVGDLLAAVGLPLAIPVVLDDALLAHASGHTMLLVDLHSGFDLTRLPVVGPLLNGPTDLGLALRVIATSGAWDAEAVGKLNGVLPEGYAALPLPAVGASLPRAGLAATVRIGAEVLALPELALDLDAQAKQPPPKVAPTPSPTPSPTPPPPAPAALPVHATPAAATAGAPTNTGAASSDVTWVPLQKSFGPLHTRQLGLRVDTTANTLEVLLDAEVSIGGLTLSLDGLSVSSPLDRVEPTFGLRGLGLDVQQGTFEIGGSFLHVSDHEYAGAASLRTTDLALSALGAYGEVNGHRSLFVYAVLDHPLGGPAFFFVTGLAAGFGYNRKLVMPAIEDVSTFLLVREAVAGASKAKLPATGDLTSKLAALEKDVPPSDGDFFLAIGVRFSTFKLLDSFVLVAVSFGSQLRIDALGLSTLVVPPPEAGAAVTPLAEVQIALRLQVVPAEGSVRVDARLTPASYVLSKQCQLSGGAAFYTWFSGPHAGDFVVTLGGYHPAFVAPDHYPQVPRLAFQWHVTEEVSLKGSLYFALTGHAFMAGGALEATYDGGSTAAWFRTGADLLIAWHPYHYDAHMFISAGARWHAIEAEVGVDLHIWGPDFAGVAVVDLVIASFTVEFGPRQTPRPDPQTWDKFEIASLPRAADVCTITCPRGLVRQLAASPGFAAEWVVSAHDLVLQVASQVPATAYRFNSATDLAAPGANHTIGVAPVDVAPGGLDAPLHVSFEILRAGSTREPVDMRLSPVLKGVPAALWGAPVGEPGPNDERQVARTLAGFALRPPPPAHAPETVPVSRSLLGWEDLPFSVPPPPWSAEPRPVGLTGDPTGGTADADVARARADLLRGLGIDPGTFRPGPSPTGTFLHPPTHVHVDLDPVTA